MIAALKYWQIGAGVALGVLLASGPVYLYGANGETLAGRCRRRTPLHYELYGRLKPQTWERSLSACHCDSGKRCNRFRLLRGEA